MRALIVSAVLLGAALLVFSDYNTRKNTKVEPAISDPTLVPVQDQQPTRQPEEVAAEETIVSTAELVGDNEAEQTNLEPVTRGNRVDLRQNKDRFITPENAGMLMYTKTEKTTRVLLQAIEEQDYDLMWSSQAMDAVNKTLIAEGVRGHADDWIVDCRTTICIVTFPDSALEDFDEDNATTALETSSFERVIWLRYYRNDSAYLFLLAPDFSYDTDGP